MPRYGTGNRGGLSAETSVYVMPDVVVEKTDAGYQCT